MSTNRASASSEHEEAWKRVRLFDRSPRVSGSTTTIICADWSKAPARRAAYVVHVGDRVVERLHATMGFRGLLDAARPYAESGSVLVGIDVPIGVPDSLLNGPHKSFTETTFIDFLIARCGDPGFFVPVTTPSAWSPHTPFFAVPPRGRILFEQQARSRGVELLRGVERMTRANPLFITSGIPGSVGSSVLSIWPHIAEARSVGDAFWLWPFDGALAELMGSNGIVVGEIFPRAAYATALIDGDAASRCRLTLAKTKSHVRAAALTDLQRAGWVTAHRVTLHDIADAHESEDAFDALLSAAALLRCTLEGLPLCAPSASPVEGGILGTGSVNLALRERTYVPGAAQQLAR